MLAVCRGSFKDGEGAFGLRSKNALPSETVRRERRREHSFKNGGADRLGSLKG